MFKKKIPQKDLRPLKIINQIVFGEQYKLEILKNNTARIQDGKKYVKTLEDSLVLLKEVRDSAVAEKLTELGFAQGKPHTVNFETGEVQEIQ